MSGCGCDVICMTDSVPSWRGSGSQPTRQRGCSTMTRPRLPGSSTTSEDRPEARSPRRDGCPVGFARKRSTESASSEHSPRSSNRWAGRASTPASTSTTSVADVAPAVEVATLHVVGEALTNVVRHSGATRASVGIRWASDVLTITVEDDGSGIPASSLNGPDASPAAGLGRESMRQRVEELGGELVIASAGTAGRWCGPPSQCRKAIHDQGAGRRRPRRGRDGLRACSTAASEFVCVGTASDGIEALAAVRQLVPDVVVMDLSMPRMDGVEATRRLHAGGGPPVLVLSMSDDDAACCPLCGPAPWATSSRTRSRTTSWTRFGQRLEARPSLAVASRRRRCNCFGNPRSRAPHSRS